jgi:hypothetical protein
MTAQQGDIVEWLANFNQRRRNHFSVTYEDGLEIINWLEANGPRLEKICRAPADAALREYSPPHKDEQSIRAQALEDAAKVVDKGLLVFDGGQITSPTDIRTIAEMCCKVIASGIRALYAAPERAQEKT